jgi:hypothetical protein
MPISGDQCMDMNDPDYSLPMDSIVGGNAGPTPDQARDISGPAKIPYADAKTIGKAPVGYTYP